MVCRLPGSLGATGPTGPTGPTGSPGADNQDFSFANENLTGVGPKPKGLLMTQMYLDITVVSQVQTVH